MANEKVHTKSQLVQKNVEPDAAAKLSDDDVRLLVEFFQLLDEWDREHTGRHRATQG